MGAPYIYIYDISHLRVNFVQADGEHKVLVFHSETGGSNLLRNVSSHLIDYTASVLRRSPPSPGFNPRLVHLEFFGGQSGNGTRVSPNTSVFSRHYHPINAPHKIVHLPQTIEEGKGKGKVYPRTGHEDPEGEQRYSCTLSLT